MFQRNYRTSTNREIRMLDLRGKPMEEQQRVMRGLIVNEHKSECDFCVVLTRRERRALDRSLAKQDKLLTQQINQLPQKAV